MTLAKKGSRRIVVDGVEFRWRVRRRPTYDQGMAWTPLTFVVEQAEQRGALLVVSMPGPHLSNWVGLPSEPVLPSTVASGVRSALAACWQPARPGPVFALTLP